MKFYPALKHSKGTHIVKFTLQYNEHVGSFTIRIEGDCKGGCLLTHPFDFFDIYTPTAPEKDNLDFWLDTDIWKFIIIFSPGTTNQIAIAVDGREVENLIVKAEIVDFIKEED